MNAIDKAMLGVRYWGTGRHVVAVEDALGSRSAESLPYEGQAKWVRAFRLARVADWLLVHGWEHEGVADEMHDELARFEEVMGCYADPYGELRDGGWG